MTNTQRTWIENASYETLLEHWRNAPAGDPMFTDPEAFALYEKTMSERKAEVGQGGHVAASKAIGWGGRR
jgi:hypothetical protein